MKWLRHQPRVEKHPDSRDAEERLAESRARWPLIHEAAAALKHERELNHFAENIKKTMRKSA